MKWKRFIVALVIGLGVWVGCSYLFMWTFTEMMIAQQSGNYVGLPSDFGMMMFMGVFIIIGSGPITMLSIYGFWDEISSFILSILKISLGSEKK